MDEVGNIVAPRERHSRLAHMLAWCPRVHEVRSSPVFKGDAVKHRFSVIQDLELRLAVIENCLRPSRHADYARMAKLCQFVRDTEQMHCAVPVEVAMADEN